MDWGAVAWIVLGILGAGLIFGGIVAYLRHTNPTVRALSAAGIASGLAMWAVIGFTVPASTSSDNGESPSPVVATGVIASGTYEPFTQERVAALLTAEDVDNAANSAGSLAVEYRDGKALAGGVDPSQVTEIETWYTAGFQSENPIQGMTFSVMDFVSADAAQAHFDKVLGETPGLVFMDPPIGDISVFVVFNGQGLGSIVMYRFGDLYVSLHTAQPSDIEPMMPVSTLQELAQLALSRMS
jgi:hypothetical protein